MSRIIKKYISLLCGTLQSVTGCIYQCTSLRVSVEMGKMNQWAECLVLRAFATYIIYRVVI